MLDACLGDTQIFARKKIGCGVGGVGGEDDAGKDVSIARAILKFQQFWQEEANAGGGVVGRQLCKSAPPHDF